MVTDYGGAVFAIDQALIAYVVKHLTCNQEYSVRLWVGAQEPPVK